MSNHRYTPEFLQQLVDDHDTWSDILDYLGLGRQGGSRTHLGSLAKKWGIDTSHLKKREPAAGSSNRRKAADEILVVQDKRCKPTKPEQLRRALIEIGRPHECEKCSCPPYWNGQPLVLQVDHINANRWDQRRENLRFLCPNCHTQTPTWGKQKSNSSQVQCGCGAKKTREATSCIECYTNGWGKTRRRVAYPCDEELKRLLLECGSVTAAAHKLGVTRNTLDSHIRRSKIDLDTLFN